jgi:hypothetical protein
MIASAWEAVPALLARGPNIGKSALRRSGAFGRNLAVTAASRLSRAAR